MFHHDLCHQEPQGKARFKLKCGGIEQGWILGQGIQWHTTQFSTSASPTLKFMFGHELCCNVHQHGKKSKDPAKFKPKHSFHVMVHFSHFGQTSRFNYLEHWPTFGHILSLKKYSKGKLAAPTGNLVGLSRPTVNWTAHCTMARAMCTPNLINWLCTTGMIT